MTTDDIDRVVRALGKVPETRLLILELARDLVNADGQIDYDRLAEKQREVNLAVAEAQAYSKGTKRAIESLARLGQERRTHGDATGRVG